jgi:hypothetical protein
MEPGKSEAAAASGTRDRQAPVLAPVLAFVCLALVAWGCGAVRQPGERTSTVAAPSSSAGNIRRPSQVTSVVPAPDARVRADTLVRVELAPTQGASTIRIDSLRLLVDGKDVTGQAQTAFTEDVPPSQGEIWFSPSPPFASGMHNAEVRFVDEEGQRFSYSWSFLVDAG